MHIAVPDDVDCFHMFRFNQSIQIFVNIQKSVNSEKINKGYPKFRTDKEVHRIYVEQIDMWKFN